MSKIKLLALDLDGTLLTHDKQISTENKVAIKQAQAAGVHVVITTGRPLKAIEHILSDAFCAGSVFSLSELYFPIIFHLFYSCPSLHTS